MSALVWTIASAILVALHICAVILTVGHLALHKRDVRSAIGWAYAVVVAPILGPIAYWTFGVNRIQRRATRIFGLGRGALLPPLVKADASLEPSRSFGAAGVTQLLDGLETRRLIPGNAVTPLVGGEEAYREMFAAIDSARSSITLSTYIFDRDEAGLEFAEALGRARERGVEVRVLIDAVGARYSLPTIIGHLRGRGLRVARFLPTRMPWRFPYFNLRNHRKILVIDGGVAFLGGMNIRQGHRLGPEHEQAIVDVHFRVEGPVATEIQSVFAEDWLFATKEKLARERFLPKVEATGVVIARAIADGPDEDLEKILWALLGAIGCAEHRIKIATPYFLPDAGLDRALEVAAGRGVDVDILLPAVNNLRLVDWASRACWRFVLEAGCRLWLTPPPFDHSKLMIMDDQWCLFGSANWDPRSLRLNFELNLECHDRRLNHRIDEIFEAKKALARRVTLGDQLGAGLPRRLLHGASRMLTPYL